MSTDAGSTAKGGILGRRKRRLQEPASFVTMWQKAENGRPELVRCLLSEARKYVAAATLADRENDHIKSRKLGSWGLKNRQVGPPPAPAAGTVAPLPRAHRKSACVVNRFASGTRQPLKGGLGTTNSISRYSAP